MEFLHKNNDPSGPVDALRLNWFYRPKDIQKRSQDTRQLFASMHSDISPLNTLRGKCTVKHRAEIVVTPDKPKAEEAIMTQYRKIPDNFWWSQMYDRYISKHYDAIPTSQVINVPERVKKVLDQQWKFILVEQGRGKELTSAVKSCKRCNGYCAKYVPNHLSSSPGIRNPPPPSFFVLNLSPYPVLHSLPPLAHSLQQVSPEPRPRALGFSGSWLRL